MKKYFEVVAKCGHVGRNQYYEGHFFVISTDAHHAAQHVKTFSRVKKDHGDVILDVIPIDRQRFLEGQEEQNNNVYFHCKNRKEQNQYWDLIKNNVYEETERQCQYRENHNLHYDKKKSRKNNKNVIRNIYKYTKYNLFRTEEYEMYA